MKTSENLKLNKHSWNESTNIIVVMAYISHCSFQYWAKIRPKIMSRKRTADQDTTLSTWTLSFPHFCHSLPYLPLFYNLIPFFRSYIYLLLLSKPGGHCSRREERNKGKKGKNWRINTTTDETGTWSWRQLMGEKWRQRCARRETNIYIFLMSFCQFYQIHPI